MRSIKNFIFISQFNFVNLQSKKKIILLFEILLPAYCKKLIKYSEVKHSNNGLIGCSVKNEKELFFDYFSIDSSINNSIQQETDFLDQPVNFSIFKNEFFINQQKILFENL